MDVLANVQTGDTYTNALTLEDDASDTVTFVIANASVLARFRTPPKRGGARNPYGPEVLLTPQTNSIKNVDGVQFRSAVAGTPARVVAQLTGPDDPQLAGGTPFTSFLGGSGGVTNILNVPTGAILPYAGAGAAPIGFVLCDGALYDGTNPLYTPLWTLVGNLYNPGGSQSAFAVPDIRGRGLVGFAAAGGHPDVSTLGANDGTALASRRPRHKHTAAFVGSAGNTGTVSNDHTHAVPGNPSGGGGANSFDTFQGNAAASFNVISGGISANHTHGFTPAGTVTAGPQTGAEPTDSQAYLVVQAIIAL